MLGGPEWPGLVFRWDLGMAFSHSHRHSKKTDSSFCGSRLIYAVMSQKEIDDSSKAGWQMTLDLSG